MQQHDKAEQSFAHGVDSPPSRAAQMPANAAQYQLGYTAANPLMANSSDHTADGGVASDEDATTGLPIARGWHSLPFSRQR